MEDQNKELTSEQRLEVERNQLMALLERGFEFTVGKARFTIREPYLGTLDRLSQLFIALDYDPKLLDDKNAFVPESKKMAAKYCKMCAMVVAIAVLNNKWKIRLFSRSLARFFYWRVKPSKLMMLTRFINMSCNLTDFIGSIISMSANKRTTMPDLMESKKA